MMSDNMIHAAQVPSPTKLGLDQTSAVMPVPNTDGPPQTPDSTYNAVIPGGGAVIDNTNGPFESLVIENRNNQTAPMTENQESAQSTPVTENQESARSTPVTENQGSAQSAPVTENFNGSLNIPAAGNPNDSLNTPLNGNSPTTDSNRTQGQAPEPIDAPYAGGLIISVVSSLALIPIENAVVTISYTGDPDTPIETLITNSSGQTETVELPAPPLTLSLDPSEEQPYAEYNIMVTAEGYEPVYVSGSEIFADVLSIQPIRMNPLETTEEDEKIVVIPPHTLFGDFPPKIPEDEIKPIAETGEIVLSRVVIPEYIIVHDGVPMDPTAPNYWVRYKDYIKNVASCEIYSTWPEATIYANILAIMSFTLNRVYTEWYGDCLFLMVIFLLGFLLFLLGFLLSLLGFPL